MSRVLAIGAHPDDVELGCGATLARHVADGDHVTILHLSHGIESRWVWETVDTDALAAQESMRLQRVGDATRAAAELGVHDVRIHGLEDQRFDEIALIDIARAIEGYIRNIEPDVIYTHWHGDLNQDHQRVAHAVRIAARPTATAAKLYAFEVLSSTEWGMTPFAPTVFVRDTCGGLFFEAKLRALRAYGEEIPEAPHPRSERAVKAQGRGRGAEICESYAEAFVLIREAR